jgi:cytochrome c2
VRKLATYSAEPGRTGLPGRAVSPHVRLPRGVALGIMLIVLVGCDLQAKQDFQPVAGGDARRGRQLVQDFGCIGCHTIPGINNAHANVGPPLTAFGDRVYIAGMLHNDSENLIRWLRDPQSVVPGNAMPNMGISEPQARDMAAFLYTLRQR